MEIQSSMKSIDPLLRWQ